MNSALEKLRKGSRQNLTAPATMIDWRPVVHEMRLFKSPEEIAVLRRAGEITAMAHTRAMEIRAGNVRVPSGRRNSPRI
ncbi:hypothetical protein ACVXHB_27350 [Escherichia coli]